MYLHSIFAEPAPTVSASRQHQACTPYHRPTRECLDRSACVEQRLSCVNCWTGDFGATLGTDLRDSERGPGQGKDLLRGERHDSGRWCAAGHENASRTDAQAIMTMEVKQTRLGAIADTTDGTSLQF